MSRLEKLIELSRANQTSGQPASLCLLNADSGTWKALRASYPKLSNPDLLKITMKAALVDDKDIKFKDPKTGKLVRLPTLPCLEEPTPPAVK